MASLFADHLPQLAAFGSVEKKPREPGARRPPMEYVSRNPAFSRNGAFMFGSTSARITRAFSPRCGSDHEVTRTRRRAQRSGS